MTGSRPTAVKEVIVTIDGAKHYGAYVVRGSTVYVRSSYGMKATELRESPPEAIATRLLSELVVQKPSAGLSRSGEDETEMIASEAPSIDHHVNFDTPAVLRIWSSLDNQRREDTAPYPLLEGTLDECIKEFMTRPARYRHLYEIQTSPQPPLVPDVLSGEIVTELARLRESL
jgi:hypothetical protein